MSNDPSLRPVPIPGASPETPHPLRQAWRGFTEVVAVIGQALLAFSELFRRRRDDTEPPAPRRGRGRSHPVEKAAPFPIND